ncbi:UNVERIFIED_CONTAM: hypothetical protein Sangu_2659800 [Sesamum angustifolium]|uniref:Reverse transcriptase domain-containing protein n=1 Tax=Sesamum angustifolium TaxID=2727405 RepID=A0AAW2J136_9LAMI
MPRSFSATSIILISKNDSTQSWFELKPISLCNVTNKILSKLLYNKISQALPDLISPSQSGFVPGRLIADNILLAQEMTHHLDMRHSKGNLILKLNMSKAYDRVKWKFLYAILEKMGFPARFIALIKHAIEHCWFTILVNGKSSGFFKSSQGLRQGDPISLASFILASEALSRGLNHLFAQNPDMLYHTGCKTRVTHLAYADDIIIFTRCEEQSLNKLMQFLDLYENQSGQEINHSKSFFTPGKKANLITHRIKSITGFNLKCLPITCLGAPLHKGHKKKILFEPLIDKIRNKISGWEHRHLSQGGRLQLIKSVLSSMPIYLLQVLSPPAGTLQKIEQLFAKVFWGSTTDHKKIHWTKWAYIYYPCEERGLRIRNIRDTVIAFSHKLWWRLRQNNTLWASFTISKYCKKSTPAFAKAKQKDSNIWRRICSIKSVSQENTFWSLGAGNVSFWYDCWLPTGTLHSLSHPNRASNAIVKSFWANHSWDIDKLKEVVPQHIMELILEIPINPQHQHVMHWKPSSYGSFSTKSAWEITRDHKPPLAIFKNLWFPLEHLGLTSNTTTELEAIYRGVKLCIDSNIRKIWVETNANVALKLISSPYQGPWHLQNLLQQIRNLLSQTEFKISHIFREGNQVTDYFANQACFNQHLIILSPDNITGIPKSLIRLDACSFPA